MIGEQITTSGFANYLKVYDQHQVKCDLEWVRAAICELDGCKAVINMTNIMFILEVLEVRLESALLATEAREDTTCQAP